MAIFHTSFLSILVFIIFLSVTSSSTGHKLNDNDIKSLCAKTSDSISKGCYKLINSDHRLANVDSKGLFNGLVDKASEKAKNIRSELNAFAKTTDYTRLRNEYKFCSEKYSEAIHKLDVAKEKVKSGDYKGAMKDAYEDIKSCKNKLNNERNDHAHHILSKHNDVEDLLNIAKVVNIPKTK